MTSPLRAGAKIGSTKTDGLDALDGLDGLASPDALANKDGLDGLVTPDGLEEWRIGFPPPSLRDIRHSPDLRLPSDVEFGLIGDPSLQVSLRASGGHGRCLDGLEALADFISTSWKM
ncbi:hypothetical protein DS62_10710 [Smithella sp. SC_K08D17]|nr:hypothetical protein KD27_09160 [Smithella sp. D17]KIE18437.1 hypothetical protein DS62_10710 [Smithella sp. SC_K08D17]